MTTGDDEGNREASLLTGSPGEHALQARYGSESRARSFYSREVIGFLSPLMRDFISRQECMFISTSDAQGRCDCSPRFGEAGFIQVLDDRHVRYPEYRGNGVFASLANITENPHIGLVIIDFYRDQIGLHINGTARIVEEQERWVVVEVEEAYVHCSKHIPRLQKLERKMDWGTDSPIAKKSDYFQLQYLSLYDRLGGEQAVNVVVNRLRNKLHEAGLEPQADLAALVSGALRGACPVNSHPGDSQSFGSDRKVFAAILAQTLQELGMSVKDVEKTLHSL